MMRVLHGECVEVEGFSDNRHRDISLACIGKAKGNSFQNAGNRLDASQHDALPIRGRLSYDGSCARHCKESRDCFHVQVARLPEGRRVHAIIGTAASLSCQRVHHR